jgi:hypothetical protein
LPAHTREHRRDVGYDRQLSRWSEPTMYLSRATMCKDQACVTSAAGAISADRRRPGQPALGSGRSGCCNGCAHEASAAQTCYRLPGQCWLRRCARCALKLSSLWNCIASACAVHPAAPSEVGRCLHPAGILPFARELIRRGTRVSLAANETPSINDITAAELQQVQGSIVCLQVWRG